MQPIDKSLYKNNTVYVYQSQSEMQSAAAEHITRYAIESDAAGAGFSIALSGGTTPGGVYRNLLEADRSTRFPWQHSKFIFGDERYVAHDDVQSNYKMAMDTFLRQAPVSEANIFPVPTDCQDPGECAEKYSRQIIQALGGDEIPVIDLVLLGMGNDGHTASLFPGTPVLNETDRAFAAVFVEKLDSWRISMTFPVITRARQVMVLVSGEDKASVLAEVMTADESRYPIQKINNPNTVLWFVDQAAASGLKNS